MTATELAEVAVGAALRAMSPEELDELRGAAVGLTLDELLVHGALRAITEELIDLLGDDQEGELEAEIRIAVAAWARA